MTIPSYRINGNSAQKLTVGASSGQSAAFGTQTRALIITALTANVHIEIGPNPVASATTSYLLKTTDPSLVIGCAPGDKIAAIQDTGAAVLYVAELSY